MDTFFILWYLSDSQKLVLSNVTRCCLKYLLRRCLKNLLAALLQHFFAIPLTTLVERRHVIQDLIFLTVATNL